jgi:hypothetical protein
LGKSRGQVELRRIQEFLRDCYPDHKFEPMLHNYRVKWNGLTFPSLPKYRHIEVGQVKKMIRVLGMDRKKANEYLNLGLKEDE